MDIIQKTITNPVKAIRAFCLECAGESPIDVKECTAPDCPLYPFRFGKNPYRKKREQAYTEEERAAISKRLAEARERVKANEQVEKVSEL